MAGRSGADSLIAWIPDAAAGVARHDVVNAAQLIIDSLQTPETAAGQSGHFFPLHICGHLIHLAFRHAHFTIMDVLYL
jgi:hypothetical protein